MSDPQTDALLVQIRELEKSSRRWKAAAIGLALVLLVFVVLGGVTSIVVTTGYAMRAARLQEQEMRAREEAEAQRQRAEQQRQEAQKRLEQAKRVKEPKP